MPWVLSRKLTTKIFKYLRVRSFISVSRACKAFYQLCGDSKYWKRLYIYTFDALPLVNFEIQNQRNSLQMTKENTTNPPQEQANFENHFKSIFISKYIHVRNWGDVIESDNNYQSQSIYKIVLAGPSGSGKTSITNTLSVKIFFFFGSLMKFFVLNRILGFMD